MNCFLWISLFAASPPDHQRETYKLEAMAQDKGYPPLSRTVEVQIDVVDRANNPPVWDHVVYGPIYVKENMPVGGKVVSIKARSVLLSLRISFCSIVREILFVLSPFFSVSHPTSLPGMCGGPLPVVQLVFTFSWCSLILFCPKNEFENVCVYYK